MTAPAQDRDHERELDLRDEIDRLRLLLPDDVLAAFDESVSASFDCGQHDMDDGPYKPVFLRSLEADAKLLGAIARLLQQQEPPK